MYLLYLQKEYDKEQAAGKKKMKYEKEMQEVDDTIHHMNCRVEKKEH